MVSNKSKGPKWDGKSRVSNDLYRKNYNKIFRKKSRVDDYDKRKAKKILAEIVERNGF